jgi:NAD-dependent SIR2 family protein deacetylase
MQEVKVPRCRICDGVMKMNVVLFGEPLESSTIEGAMAAAKTADVILVVGTSLTVGSVLHPSFSSSSFICLKTCSFVNVYFEEEAGRSLRVDELNEYIRDW